jgi:hypothetical protein
LEYVIPTTAGLEHRLILFAETFRIPISSMPLISIAQRNRAPSAEDARHDVHGGFAERGGSCRLGVHELSDHTFWREALQLAGCGWVIEILESRMGPSAGEDIELRNADAVRAILDARAEKQLCLQRSSIEPDAERRPLHESPHIEDADCSIQCDVCPDGVPLPFDRLFRDSAAWLHGLSDIEWNRVRSAFACRVEITPSGHRKMVSHDAGAPGFGLTSCDGCGQRYAVYVTCEERKPARYHLRLQGLARVVRDAPDSAEPAPIPAPQESVAVAAAAPTPEETPAPRQKRKPPTPGWWSAPDEPPLYYVSMSNKPGAIAREIAIVHAQMQERRKADHAERGNALYLQSDGTQSKLYMYWKDRSKGEVAGDWRYTLVLRDAEFPDADAFETTCRRAVGFFVRKHAPEDLRVFFHREYDPFGRRVYATGQTPSRR